MIVPLNDGVLILPEEVNNKTAGGIILPSKAIDEATQETHKTGKVVAVGPGILFPDGSLRDMQVKPGDTIIYSKYSGIQLKQGGYTYLLIKEIDVLALLK